MALRILIVLLILAVPLELPACGPYLPVQIFHFEHQPEAPDQFLRGQLGILQPSYDGKYQFVAYRYLSGVGLNEAEQRALTPPPEPASTSQPSNPWLDARNAVAGVTPIREIDAFRQVQKQGFFDTYLNCNDDAFRTAAATLERVRKTAGVNDWIAAQDLVFSNCSKGAAIPQPAADPQLRADRAYQIASAEFYSEQYDAARADFQAIASDTASPWRQIAPYLAARCLIRAGKMADAETELKRIAADPAMGRWRDCANGLLGFVNGRQHPSERLHELSAAIVKPNSQATIAQDVADYLLLADRMAEHNQKPQPADGLTDWIASFDANGAGALDKWRATHSLPWLVGALEFSRTGDSALAELLPAAAAVKPDSPGFLTVNYLRVRLMPPDDARALADKLLAGNLPAPARNQILAERMDLARDFDEFLKFARRRPVAVVTYEVAPVDSKEDSLDDDATGVLNLDLPLAYLKRAAAGNLLPARVRAELQQTIFVRTLLLSAAPSFDQVFKLLHSPGMQPNLEPGSGRNTSEVDKIDDYGDNWWCSASAQKDAQPGKPARQPGAPYLSPADRQAAADEAKKIEAAGSGPDWLGAQTLAFAQQSPQDPRIPEALYLVVRATRYGCTDRQTGDVSKGAFDLLHRRYPNNEWTKKTPYWFKGNQ